MLTAGAPGGTELRGVKELARSRQVSYIEKWHRGSIPHMRTAEREKQIWEMEHICGYFRGVQSLSSPFTCGPEYQEEPSITFFKDFLILTGLERGEVKDQINPNSFNLHIRHRQCLTQAARSNRSLHPWDRVLGSGAKAVELPSKRNLADLLCLSWKA